MFPDIFPFSADIFDTARQEAVPSINKLAVATGNLQRVLIGLERGFFHAVEKLAGEVVHACAKVAAARGELVVGDDRGDSDQQSGGGGDEGFRKPGATARRVAVPSVPRPWKASTMPMMVPKRPMKGEMAPMLASQVSRCSMAVSDSLAAVCAARSRAVMLRGGPYPPVCRL